MRTEIKILAVDESASGTTKFVEHFNTLPFVKIAVNCAGYSDLMLKMNYFQPNIVFLDINIPGNNGFSVCRELKQQYSNTSVMFLTRFNFPKFASRARESGADGYFLKQENKVHLTSFLRNYYEGKVLGWTTDPNVSTAPGIFSEDNASLKQTLSNREKEVMTLLVHGFEHDEIENILNVSYETFKTHRTNLMQKLRVRNIAELVLFCIRHKWVSDPSVEYAHLQYN